MKYPLKAHHPFLPEGDAVLSLRKPDGTVLEGIAAEFSPKAILITDAANPIEVGDMLIRTLSSGLQVGFIVDDPGYRDALGSILAHFEIKAHRAAPIDSLEPSGFWRRRRANFERLLRRQRYILGIDRDHPKWLRGFCSLLEDEAGELAYCDVDGGLDLEFRSKFKDVATQAGNALGRPSDDDPERFLTSCLCLDLLQNSPEGAGKELLQSVPGGGFITDLLGSLASYCSRLAAMADRNANDARSRSIREVPASDIERCKAERKKLRDCYKADCKRAGVRVTDEMIAIAANPRWKSRTNIQKWLSCDPKYKDRPDRLIRDVFLKKPHLPRPKSTASQR